MPDVVHRSALTENLVLCLALAIGLLCLPATVVAASGANAVPYIDLPLLPTSVKPGGAAFTLTVNGAGFVAGSVVNWDGSPRATVFVSATQLTASILASDIAKATTAFITVSSPAPGGGTSNVAFLHVVNQEPAVGLAIKGTCGPAPAVVADFNNDGKLDLGVVDSASSTISILLGRGNGTFQTRSTFKTSRYPEGIVVADFNGDGKLDLAVPTTDDLIGIYLGNGDGTFTAKATVQGGVESGSLVAGDFNEDGNLDLAVILPSGGWISIFFGNGDGTFQPRFNINIGGVPVSMVVGDFNNDGHLDLALSSWVFLGGRTYVSVLLGNGDGTFQSPIISDVTTVGLLAAADVNGDGRLDVVVGNVVLLGGGNGSFSELGFSLPWGAFALGDFNGDNKVDLAIAHGRDVSIFLGYGDGTFRAPETYFSSSFVPINSVVVGDFNGDGRLDLNEGCVFLQTARAVTTSYASLIFGQRKVGTTSPPKQVTLTNGGTQTVSISQIASTGDFSQSNNCPSALDMLKSCVITVTFTPTATGTRTGSLSFTDNAANSPQTVQLTGTGID
jgi:VCBS repeat protein/ASPM-SPD-2-Hydin domain-containing protein